MCVKVTNGCVPKEGKMDPRKKKEQSLKHDRRNTYGENDKSSRKSIRRRKRLVNQIYRHKVNQVLEGNDTEAAEGGVAEIRRPNWKKSPDEPLGDVLRKDLIGDIRTMVCSKSFDPVLFDRLEELMKEKGWEEPGIRVVIRRLRGARIIHGTVRLDIDLRTARKLMPLLEEITASTQTR